MDAGRYSSYTQKETFCADVEKTAARFAQISDPSLGTSLGCFTFGLFVWDYCIFNQRYYHRNNLRHSPPFFLCRRERVRVHLGNVAWRFWCFGRNIFTITTASSQHLKSQFMNKSVPSLQIVWQHRCHWA